jgi:hypothetical protein
MMMTRMLTASLAAVSLLTVQCVPLPANAENQMGYRLLSPQEASRLPHNQGALGLSVERAQQITDGGMTFDIIRVTRVRRDSTGAQAGINVGDEIIAVDGRVFSSLADFAAYVGSFGPAARSPSTTSRREADLSRPSGSPWWWVLLVKHRPQYRTMSATPRPQQGCPPEPRLPSALARSLCLVAMRWAASPIILRHQTLVENNSSSSRIRSSRNSQLSVFLAARS